MIVRKRYLLGGLLKTGAKSVYKANKDSIKSFMKDKLKARKDLKKLKSEGRKPNFKGGLVRKPKLAKRGF